MSILSVRLVTAVGDWLSSGGLFITAGCLASFVTIIIILSVAVLLVRARRRRQKTLSATTKIELQQSQCDETTQDPLLTGQICDVALSELQSEPVRYVVSHSTCIMFLRLHTADKDNTRLSCLVTVGDVDRISDKSRLSATENFETVCPVLHCG